MIRKKERIHEAGASNIDFRSIGDKKSVEFFQPWKKTKEFGMMGHSRLDLQVKDMQNFLKSSKNILTNKEKNFQSLSPRIYSAVKFYNKNNVPFKKRTYFDSDKLAELDENLKGKEIYIGDSMMIGSNTKRKKAKIIHAETFFPVVKNNRGLSKIDRNKLAEEETQLITVKAPETKDDHIDLGKIRDIRRTLKRRYSNRGNFAKIFRDWDTARDGLIGLNDLQSMLTKMGISINVNEAKALIASANSTVPDKLDMDDFLYLIFNENDEIDNEALNSKTIKSPAELEELNRKMRMISYKSSGKENIQNLKSFLRTRIPLLLKSFSLHSDNNNLCTIQQFSDSIKGLKIGSRFTTNEILTQIFDEYKNSQDVLEIDKFVNDLSEARNKNNFFAFQEKYLKLIEEKSVKTKNDLETYMNENTKLIKAEEEIIKRKREVLEEQINNRINKPKLNSFDDRYIRNSQPSKEFLLQSMSKRDDYTKKHRDLVKLFEPQEVLEDYKELQGRYMANRGMQKSSSVSVSSFEGSGHYISEKERFDKNYNIESIVKEEKENKKLGFLSKSKSIQESLDFIKERNDIENFLNQSKKIYSINEKSKKILLYEHKNNLRNSFIE